MKNKLHGLCIRFGWYREVFTGHYDIGRTLFGVYFLIGDYMPLTLQRCIDLEMGYNEDVIRKMISDLRLEGAPIS
jgi:hypothetical protein|tara:strand:+ start:270 stop:494 length:225 start_codon:yes stop_codon:yes gene_type:complete